MAQMSLEALRNPFVLKLPSLFLLISFFYLPPLKAQETTEVIDSSKAQLWLNTGLYGPLVHPGFLVGMDVTLWKNIKTKERGKIAMKMGLRETPKLKTIQNGFYIEPHVGVYNHRFNHMGILLGSSFKFQHQFNSGLYYFGGFEAGRLIRLHKDVVVFDERNNPNQRNVTSSGHYQLGTQAGIGFQFKAGPSIFYRYHVGLLFPFNHLAAGYARHELGLKLFRIR